MTNRAMQGDTPPSTLRQMKRFLRDLKRGPDPTPEQLDYFNKEIERAFPGGFDLRDEANAIVAMAVRNGPLEGLHAGWHSALLEDDTLSRLTDEKMKALMLYATRTVAMMLWMRDEDPEVYRRYIRSYGWRYCRAWERSRR
jgi:hypothetical protein